VEATYQLLSCLLLLWLGPWLATTGTVFNLKGGLWNRGDGGEGHRRRGGAWVAAQVWF
jgi:hypothetical protein